MGWLITKGNSKPKLSAVLNASDSESSMSIFVKLFCTAVGGLAAAYLVFGFFASQQSLAIDARTHAKILQGALTAASAGLVGGAFAGLYMGRLIIKDNSKPK